MGHGLGPETQSHQGIEFIQPDPDAVGYFVSVALIKLKKDIVSSYFANFALQSPQTWKQVYTMSEGSALKHMVLRNIKALRIPIPSIEEQKKIVTILSEVDAKIENEEAYKTELEQLKKGLMQVLLTGKVRVKVDEEALEEREAEA